MTGKVNRAFAVNRIPAGRIGRTEILHFQADAYHCFFRRQLGDAPGCFPGGAAGGPAHDDDLLKPAVDCGHLELGRPELLSVPAQAVLPGKPASSGRCQDTFHLGLFPGSHHRYAATAARSRQVMGQIRVTQKVENQIRFEFQRQVCRRVVYDRRQLIVDMDAFDFKPAGAVTADTLDLFIAAAVLLKNSDFLNRVHKLRATLFWAGHVGIPVTSWF